MSLFKRIATVFRAHKNAEAPLNEFNDNPYEQADVGDILYVDLEEWLITGKVTYQDPGFSPHRFMYYLQSGNEIACLIIEKGATYDCLFGKFVKGGLDNPTRVPTHLTVGDKQFRLENQRKDMVITSGNTDFRSNDQVKLWRYFGKGNTFFILQWQDGKFVACEAMRVLPAEIIVLKNK